MKNARYPLMWDPNEPLYYYASEAEVSKEDKAKMRLPDMKEPAVPCEAIILGRISEFPFEGDALIVIKEIEVKYGNDVQSDEYKYYITNEWGENE